MENLALLEEKTSAFNNTHTGAIVSPRFLHKRSVYPAFLLFKYYPRFCTDECRACQDTQDKIPNHRIFTLYPDIPLLLVQLQCLKERQDGVP